MRKFLLFLAALFFINAESKPLCVDNTPTTHVTYDIRRSPRGSQRMPMRLSFLPITWVDGNAIHFQWTTAIPSVNIYVTDEFGAVVNQANYAAVAGSQSLMDITGLDEGRYTIHVCIEGQEYLGTFTL